MATPTEPTHDEQCEAEFVLGAGTWTDCGCLGRRNATAVATSTEPTAPTAGCNGCSEPDDDEYAASLLDVEPETPARRMTCRCFVTPESEWVWDSAALAYEPASQWEQNPDCPIHTEPESPPWWVCAHCGFDAKAFEPRPEKVAGAARWHAAVCKSVPADAAVS